MLATCLLYVLMCNGQTMSHFPVIVPRMSRTLYLAVMALNPLFIQHSSPYVHAHAQHTSFLSATWLPQETWPVLQDVPSSALAVRSHPPCGFVSS